MGKAHSGISGDKRLKPSAAGTLHFFEFGSLSTLKGTEIAEFLKDNYGNDSAFSPIILLEDPIIDIARRLECNKPEDACVQWSAVAKSVLNIRQQARRRVTLVNRACLTGPTREEAALLAERFGQEAGRIGAEGQHERLPHPEPLGLACAALIIDADQGLRTLARELRVATIGGLRILDMVAIAREAYSSRDDQLSSRHDKEKDALAEALRSAETKLREAEIKSGLLHKSATLALEQSTLRLAELERRTQELKSAKEALAALQLKTQEIEPKLQTARVRTAALQEELEEIRYLRRFDAAVVGGDLALLSAKLDDLNKKVSALPYKQPDGTIPPGMEVLDDWTAQMQVGQAGERAGALLLSRRKAGHVFFGPYQTVSPGFYVTDIIIDLRSVLNSPGYFLEMLAHGEVIGISELLLVRGRNRFLAPFHIPTGRGEAECEIRLYAPGKATIALRRLRVLKAHSQSPSEAEVAPT